MTLRLALWRALLQLLELENLHRLVTMWTSVILLFAALAFYQVFVTTKAPDVEVAETYLVDDVAVAGATEGLPKLPVLLVEDLLEGIEAEASLSMARWQETERSTISTADAERTSVRSIHALTEIHLPVYVRGGRRPSGLLSDRMHARADLRSNLGRSFRHSRSFSRSHAPRGKASADALRPVFLEPPHGRIAISSAVATSCQLVDLDAERRGNIPTRSVGTREHFEFCP